jgi:aminopeptidase-like protein
VSVRRLLDELDVAAAGVVLHDFVERAYPIPRSLTGDGVRATLRLVQERLLGERARLEVHEVPTGTPVLDWTVPREWNVREAWVAGPDGKRVVDFADSSLNLLGYSIPVHRRLKREELDRRLHSLPDRPHLVPYRTSYYAERWGFCLPHALREALPDGDYEVKIDATLADGALTYGECVLEGASDREVLVSTHVCHPALANDNLSGIAVTAALAARLARLEPHQRRYTWRFLFVPGTIGAITWLARNEGVVPRVAHGLVAANLGDPGGFCYKRSRRGDAPIDRLVEVALRDLGESLEVEDFVPFGYDERQYCSPGFDLPVGSLTRTPWGRYPEYHTSADDPSFVRAESLGGSLRAYLAAAAAIEGNRRYRNLSPEGEPQLGRRGLYRTLGGDDAGRERELALLWVLNQSDGRHDLLDVAERSGMALARLEEAASALVEVALLEEV